MSICFPLVDDVHDFIRTGDKAFRTALPGRTAVLLQEQQEVRSLARGPTFTKGTRFLSSWTARFVFDTGRLSIHQKEEKDTSGSRPERWMKFCSVIGSGTLPGTRKCSSNQGPRPLMLFSDLLLLCKNVSSHRPAGL